MLSHIDLICGIKEFHDIPDFAHTCHEFGVFYSENSRMQDAERMLNSALAGKEKALGPDHTSTLATVNNLANLYLNQGRLSDAERMYNRALARKGKALGPDHISTLNTVNNLAVL